MSDNQPMEEEVPMEKEEVAPPTNGSNGYTQPRFVYLARPIDGVNTSTHHQATITRVRQQVDSVKETLAQHGVGWYDPAAAFGAYGVPVGPEIGDINSVALLNCQAIIAWIPDGIPTIGTILEVATARSWGTQTAVITSSNNIRRSWSLNHGTHDSSLYRIYSDAEPASVVAAARWIARGTPLEVEV